MIGTTPESVRWIAFDAVGTLIYPNPPVAQVYAEIGGRYGSQRNHADVVERFARCFRTVEEEGRAGSLTTSEHRERQRWRRIVGCVLDDVCDSEQCFSELYLHFSRPEAWACFDDVPAAVTKLQGYGYRLAVASNFDRRLYDVCRGLEPLARMDPIVISSEVEYRKPHPQFFAAVARRLSVPVGQILHVGDDYDNDHQGALAAGMPSIWLRRGVCDPGEDAAPDLAALTGRLAPKRRSFSNG